MSSTEGIRSPNIFRLWAGLVTIAGVLQRRVYTYTNASSDPLCPNLWVSLVGAPATGKSVIIKETRKFWSKIKGLYIASDNMTHASFVAEFENSTRFFMNGSEELSIFSSLAAPISEFGIFFPKFDMEFLSILSDFYDNIEQYREPRTTVNSRKVDRPNLNMICGITPDFMGDLFPETAWGQGFTARLIFIYSETVKFNNIGYFTKRKDKSNEILIKRLEEMFELGGEFEWSEEAQEAHINWLDNGQPGAPDHGRLRHYASRRDIQIMKLAMISSVSAGRNLYIDIEDYERAHTWLRDAESVMPDVFRAMGQKSDAQLISDLWQFCYTEWVRHVPQQRVSLEDKLLWNFLKDRIPSSNIPRVIEAAERSGMIRRDPNFKSITPQWIPRPINEHIRL